MKYKVHTNTEETHLSSGITTLYYAVLYNNNISLFTGLYVYIYIYMCVCVCTCIVCLMLYTFHNIMCIDRYKNIWVYTYHYTIVYSMSHVIYVVLSIYIYMYVYIYIYVCILPGINDTMCSSVCIYGIRYRVCIT